MRKKLTFIGHLPGVGNGNPLQYSCLENYMDEGTWWAAVHGVAKSQTHLSNFTGLLIFNKNKNIKTGSGLNLGGNTCFLASKEL